MSYTVLCNFTLTVAQDYLSTTRKANTTSSISSAMDIVIDTSNMNVEPQVLFHHFASLSSHLCNESQQFSRMTHIFFTPNRINFSKQHSVSFIHSLFPFLLTADQLMISALGFARHCIGSHSSGSLVSSGETIRYAGTQHHALCALSIMQYAHSGWFLLCTTTHK